MDLSVIIEKVTNLPPVSLGIALVAVLVTILYFALSSRGLPPGPTGIPLFGYWPFLDTKATYLQLDKMKKKYGDVFSFTCSGTLYINLGTVKAIREAHVSKGDCFGSRMTDFTIFSYAFRDTLGLINGEPWKVLRKFFLGVMKERGLTSMKDSMSGPLIDTVASTIDHLRSKKGEPEDLLTLLTEKCSSNLRQILFGGDECVTAEQMREIYEHFGALSQDITSRNMLLTGNIARMFFSILPSVRKSMSHRDPMEKCIFKIVEDHKSTYNEDRMRDIIDEYFKERDLRRSKGDPTAQYFTDKNLVGTLVQFLGDGVLGVASFIGGFLINLIQYPEEQEKIYKELQEVVGENRQPTLEDKSKLTYTNAFILEGLRVSEFFPFFPSLQCTKETTLRGYRIPVGAITLMNFWSAHFDPDVYEEPEKFNPSRFISKEEGKRAELPVVFGIGKRSCMGEGFVMLQVFLFLISLVKNFRLTVKDKKDAQLELFTGKVEVCAVPRG